MTAQRQERNGRRPIVFAPNSLYCLLAAFGTVLGLFAARPPPPSGWWSTATPGLRSRASTPSAYFVDARPVIGASRFEAAEAGAVWRFRNEGNRAAFVAHPEIYGPQFGGYDPIDLARGVTVAGNPAVLADRGAAALSVRPREQQTIPRGGVLTSLPGLTRQSILFERLLRRGWIRGSSPRMTQRHRCPQICLREWEVRVSPSGKGEGGGTPKGAPW
jgi:hypothetical protein